VSAGTQPDWYIGWLDGALRLMPNVELNFAHHYTLSLNILVPAVIVPGILFTLLALYPFLEAWITGDHKHHHLLDRPRNRPNRTAIGMAMMSLFIVLLLAGGNDIFADKFSLSINELTWIFRVAFFVLPLIVFVITKRICLGLQKRDRDLLHHGVETGTIKMLPTGEFIEVHAPAGDKERVFLTAAAATSRIPELEATRQGTDGNGRRRRPLPTGPAAMVETARKRIVDFFYDEVEPDPEDDQHTPAVH
jgi:ubiquinol-cytochrome c reductase cytochrome b subunit